MLDLDFKNLDSIFTGDPFQLNLVSKDDQINFIGNVLDQVERIEGSYEAAFTVGGTIEKPALVDGYFRMEDGRMILSRVRNPITELDIDATIDSSIMVINSLSAYANKETDFWDDAIGVVSGLGHSLKVIVERNEHTDAVFQGRLIDLSQTGARFPRRKRQDLRADRPNLHSHQSGDARDRKAFVRGAGGVRSTRRI